MNQKIEQLMERASQSLAGMAYFESQGLCIEAMGCARDAGEWDTYRKILLPLQEVRRQIRMSAGDGIVLIGSEHSEHYNDFVNGLVDGCLFITDDVEREVVEQILDAATAGKKSVEVLVGYATETGYEVRSYDRDIALVSGIDEPLDDWVGHAIATPESGSVGGAERGLSILGWFIDAGEKLGDVAIQRAHKLEGMSRIKALEEGLKVVPNHELLHQALSDCVLETCL